LTSETNLLDISLSDGSNNISIAVPDGDNIEVFFGVQAISDPPPYKVGATRNAALTFSAAVVPEPISSILFITGGTLLAGRRYIKRNKKA
jgi:hypothetical protein